jgi:hypothetical protein
VRLPYHTYRQQAIGEALDLLQEREVLDWVWDYDTKRRRALWRVRLRGRQHWHMFYTREAEGLLVRHLGPDWKQGRGQNAESDRATVRGVAIEEEDQ